MDLEASMYAFIAIALALAAVPIHEFGHYKAYWEYGIPVREFALLGQRTRMLPSLSYTDRNGTCWSIHMLFVPFFLGSYVLTDPIDGTKHRTMDRMYMQGSGIMANLVYAILLLAVVSAWDLPVQGFSPIGIVAIYPVLLLIAVILSLKSHLSCVAWPFWWAISFTGIPVMLFSHWPLEEVRMGMGGPVTIILGLAKADSLYDAFSRALRSVNFIVMMNTLPLYPLDGGQVFCTMVKRMLDKWPSVDDAFERHFKRTTWWIFVAICLYCVLLDGIMIFLWIRSYMS
jgi:hypothetical protein